LQDWLNKSFMQPLYVLQGRSLQLCVRPPLTSYFLLLAPCFLFLVCGGLYIYGQARYAYG
jgi:hypothetical protein